MGTATEVDAPPRATQVRGARLVRPLLVLVALLLGIGGAVAFDGGLVPAVLRITGTGTSTTAAAAAPSRDQLADPAPDPSVASTHATIDTAARFGRAGGRWLGLLTGGTLALLAAATFVERHTPRRAHPAHRSGDLRTRAPPA